MLINLKVMYPPQCPFASFKLRQKEVCKKVRLRAEMLGHLFSVNNFSKVNCLRFPQPVSYGLLFHKYVRNVDMDPRRCASFAHFTLTCRLNNLLQGWIEEWLVMMKMINCLHYCLSLIRCMFRKYNIYQSHLVQLLL